MMLKRAETWILLNSVICGLHLCALPWIATAEEDYVRSAGGRGGGGMYVFRGSAAVRAFAQPHAVRVPSALAVVDDELHSIE